MMMMRLTQIYNNTLHNWPLLGDKLQLAVHPILFVITNGTDAQSNTNATMEIALSLGWTVLEVPRVSRIGVPCIRDMFTDVAQRFTNCTFHAYTNGDILFDGGLAQTLHAVAKVHSMHFHRWHKVIPFPSSLLSPPTSLHVRSTPLSLGKGEGKRGFV